MPNEPYAIVLRPGADGTPGGGGVAWGDEGVRLYGPDGRCPVCCGGGGGTNPDDVPNCCMDYGSVPFCGGSVGVSWAVTGRIVVNAWAETNLGAGGGGLRRREYTGTANVNRSGSAAPVTIDLRNFLRRSLVDGVQVERVVSGMVLRLDRFCPPGVSFVDTSDDGQPDYPWRIKARDVLAPGRVDSGLLSVGLTPGGSAPFPVGFFGGLQARDEAPRVAALGLRHTGWAAWEAFEGAQGLPVTPEGFQHTQSLVLGNTVDGACGQVMSVEAACVADWTADAGQTVGHGECTVSLVYRVQWGTCTAGIGGGGGQGGGGPGSGLGGVGGGADPRVVDAAERALRGCVGCGER